MQEAVPGSEAETRHGRKPIWCLSYKEVFGSTPGAVECLRASWRQSNFIFTLRVLCRCPCPGVGSAHGPPVLSTWALKLTLLSLGCKHVPWHFPSTLPSHSGRPSDCTVSIIKRTLHPLSGKAVVMCLSHVAMHSLRRDITVDFICLKG